ncbi:HNH endonuclease [Sulfurovum sp. CS9]|uniref:HNH endonuclease n=1 Tax=Sulfurovum sp. CS9 TaxID=3391146 RepID=UPI0039EAF027
MPNIPDGITQQNILEAARVYDNKTISHQFSHSTTYDVIISGHRYPPKAIVGIASNYHLGQPLTPDDFSGGLHTKCFRVLRENGFRIILKKDDIVYPDEIPKNIVHTEGSVKQVTINSYERDTDARDKCIEYYGLKCQACDFDFEDVYGDLGAGFIHVHHLVQISSIKEKYIIDPIKDLRPVCPNCHAMLHKRKKKPYTIDELKEIINR